MSICDYYLDSYLQNGSGDPEKGEQYVGNRIRAAQQKAAFEWAGKIDDFLPSADDLYILPDGSWLFEMRFTLRKPFTSKSETGFPYEIKSESQVHLMQNPIVRDHLTSLPLVKPTTWKGHLRFAMKAQRVEEGVCQRLFGTSEDDIGQAGRLHFFPTFFPDSTSREVITPLNRDTRTPARGPIDIEVVGPGQQGRFVLLYSPRPKGWHWHEKQIAEDLVAAIYSVKAMLLDYGFSAKKTSGWGLVQDSVDSGILTAKGAQWPELTRSPAATKNLVEPEETFKKFMDEAGQPIADLRKGIGKLLSNPEYKASGITVGSLTEFKKFRAWYDKFGEEWARKQGARVGSAFLEGLHRYEFGTLSECTDIAARLAKPLRENANG